MNAFTLDEYFCNFHSVFKSILRCKLHLQASNCHLWNIQLQNTLYNIFVGFISLNSVWSGKKKHIFHGMFWSRMVYAMYKLHKFLFNDFLEKLHSLNDRRIHQEVASSNDEDEDLELEKGYKMINVCLTSSQSSLCNFKSCCGATPLNGHRGRAPQNLSQSLRKWSSSSFSIQGTHGSVLM